MKVEIKSPSKTTFGDLQDGDVFKFDGGIYMKVEELLRDGYVVTNSVFLCPTQEAYKLNNFSMARMGPKYLVEKFNSATLVLE